MQLVSSSKFWYKSFNKQKTKIKENLVYFAVLLLFYMLYSAGKSDGSSVYEGVQVILETWTFLDA